jgi:4-amino-4-deoxy-L-arabinose transferase-like glycosyltransferase
MILVLILTVVAFLLRLAVLRALPVIDTDGVIYVTLARQLRTGGSPFDPLFHPLYPLAIALAEPLTGDWELAARLVSALLGALLILPAYALARALLGVEAARLAAALMVVHPALVRAGTAAMSEATYAFVLACGVFTAWRALAAGPRPLLVLSGLLFGLAYLARPEGALYLAGLLAAVVYLAAKERRRVRELALWGGAALVAFLLVAAPYLVYLRSIRGAWTLSGKIGHNFGLEQGTAGAPSALPLRVLENAFLFEKYALPDLFPGVLVLLVLPGVLARARRPGWLARDGVLLAACLPPLASFAFHIESRFFFPVLPFILPFAGAGALWAASAVVEERRARRWALALTAVVALALLPYALRPVFRPDAGAALYRQAAAWVAETQPRDAVLMDRKPFIAFYSGRRVAPLPPVDPPALLSAARGAGARLVVLDSRELPYDRGHLLPLVWGPPPPGLELLRDFDAAPGDRLRILLVRPGE